MSLKVAPGVCAIVGGLLNPSLSKSVNTFSVSSGRHGAASGQAFTSAQDAGTGGQQSASRYSG